MAFQRFDFLWNFVAGTNSPIELHVVIGDSNAMTGFNVI